MQRIVAVSILWLAVCCIAQGQSGPTNDAAAPGNHAMAARKPILGRGTSLPRLKNRLAAPCLVDDVRNSS